LGRGLDRLCWLGCRVFALADLALGRLRRGRGELLGDFFGLRGRFYLADRLLDRLFSRLRGCLGLGRWPGPRMWRLFWVVGWVGRCGMLICCHGGSSYAATA